MFIRKLHKNKYGILNVREITNNTDLSCVRTYVMNVTNLMM